MLATRDKRGWPSAIPSTRRNIEPRKVIGSKIRNLNRVPRPNPTNVLQIASVVTHHSIKRRRHISCHNSEGRPPKNGLKSCRRFSRSTVRRRPDSCAQRLRAQSLCTFTNATLRGEGSYAPASDFFGGFRMVMLRNCEASTASSVRQSPLEGGYPLSVPHSFNR